MTPIFPEITAWAVSTADRLAYSTFMMPDAAVQPELALSRAVSSNGLSAAQPPLYDIGENTVVLTDVELERFRIALPPKLRCCFVTIFLCPIRPGDDVVTSLDARGQSAT